VIRSVKGDADKKHYDGKQDDAGKEFHGYSLPI
jgi:hypothetical protein